MGADKATLIFAGTPLWSRQLDTLRQMRPDKMLISARFRPAWTPADTEAVLDEPPSQGPLSGLSASLRHSRTTHLLALAIDLPKMTTGHLTELWRLARPDIGVIPQCGSYCEPLTAIYPVSAASMAESALASGRLSLQSLIEHMLEQNIACIYSVRDADRPLYRNVNSQDDLE